MSRSQLSRPVFVVLLVVIHFAVVFSFSSYVYFSNQLSAALVATSLGFFFAKLFTKNRERTWIELAWFTALNICTTFFGAGMQGALGADRAPGSVEWAQIIFAFSVSMIVFLAQRKRQNMGEGVPRSANEQKP